MLYFRCIYCRDFLHYRPTAAGETFQATEIKVSEPDVPAGRIYACVCRACQGDNQHVPIWAEQS